jgi:hypothetical protein
MPAQPLLAPVILDVLRTSSTSKVLSTVSSDVAIEAALREVCDSQSFFPPRDWVSFWNSMGAALSIDGQAAKQRFLRYAQCPQHDEGTPEAAAACRRTTLRFMAFLIHHALESDQASLLDAQHETQVEWHAESSARRQEAVDELLNVLDTAIYDVECVIRNRVVEWRKK